LNLKVVDIVESYNFHIKCTSIGVQTKKLQNLKTDWTPAAVAHDGSTCYSTARAPTVVGHGGKSLSPSPTVRW
jgi:hypothetical protein